MNDKIRRFTTQLSDAAPLAPELDGRALPALRTPLTAMRVGVAIAVVGVLGVVALTVAGGDDRSAVVPASGSDDIASAIQAVLPDGFRLEFVERRDSPDAAPSEAVVPAHAVAINDRLEVLDIEFMALNRVVEDTLPDEISPDTEPTGNVSSGELITDTTVTDTTVTCITRTSTPDAAECLEYSDEGTAVTLSPPETAVPQPQCYVLGPLGDATSGTTSIPCTLEQIESGEVRINADCTLYVRSEADIPQATSECPELAVIFDPTVDSTIPVAGTSPPGAGSVVTETTVRGDGESNIDEGTGPIYDAFGPDRNGRPSPFQGASTTTSQVFVTVTQYSLHQGFDLGGLSALIAARLGTIPDLAAAIAVLPEPLAPADLNMSSPVTGTWTTASMTSGSLSVSLWRGLTDGAVIVQISYPGRLEASGNDGDVFWHALTPSAGDGRVSIVHFLRGSRDALTDADAAALAYKIADFWTDAPAVILGITQNILAVPAGGQPPVTEAPVDPTVPDPSAP